MPLFSYSRSLIHRNIHVLPPYSWCALCWNHPSGDHVFFLHPNNSLRLTRATGKSSPSNHKVELPRVLSYLLSGTSVKGSSLPHTRIRSCQLPIRLNRGVST